MLDQAQHELLNHHADENFKHPLKRDDFVFLRPGEELDEDFGDGEVFVIRTQMHRHLAALHKWAPVFCAIDEAHEMHTSSAEAVKDKDYHMTRTLIVEFLNERRIEGMTIGLYTGTPAWGEKRSIDDEPDELKGNAPHFSLSPHEVARLGLTLPTRVVMNKCSKNREVRYPEQEKVCKELLMGHVGTIMVAITDVKNCSKPARAALVAAGVPDGDIHDYFAGDPRPPADAKVTLTTKRGLTGYDVNILGHTVEFDRIDSLIKMLQAEGRLGRKHPLMQFGTYHMACYEPAVDAKRLADRLSMYHGTSVGTLRAIRPGMVSVRVLHTRNNDAGLLEPGRDAGEISISGEGGMEFVAEELPEMRVVLDACDKRFKRTFAALTNQRAKQKAAAAAKRAKQQDDILARIEQVVAYRTANDGNGPPQSHATLGTFYRSLTNGEGEYARYYAKIEELDADLMAFIKERNAHIAASRAVSVTHADVQLVLDKNVPQKLIKVHNAKTDEQRKNNAVNDYIRDKKNRDVTFTVNGVHGVKCASIVIPTNKQWESGKYREEHAVERTMEFSGGVATTKDRIKFQQLYKRAPMAKFAAEKPLLAPEVKWTLEAYLEAGGKLSELSKETFAKLYKQLKDALCTGKQSPELLSDAFDVKKPLGKAHAVAGNCPFGEATCLVCIVKKLESFETCEKAQAYYSKHAECADRPMFKGLVKLLTHTESKLIDEKRAQMFQGESPRIADHVEHACPAGADKCIVCLDKSMPESYKQRIAASCDAQGKERALVRRKTPEMRLQQKEQEEKEKKEKKEKKRKKAKDDHDDGEKKKKKKKQKSSGGKREIE